MPLNAKTIADDEFFFGHKAVSYTHLWRPT